MRQKIMEINFECSKCRSIFNNDVGNVSVDENTLRPQFENGVFCPAQTLEKSGRNPPAALAITGRLRHNRESYHNTAKI